MKYICSHQGHDVFTGLRLGIEVPLQAWKGHHRSVGWMTPVPSGTAHLLPFKPFQYKWVGLPYRDETGGFGSSDSLGCHYGRAHLQKNLQTPARRPRPAEVQAVLLKPGHGKLYPWGNLQSDRPASLHKSDPKQLWLMQEVPCLSLEMFNLVFSSFISVYRMPLIQAITRFKRLKNKQNKKTHTKQINTHRQKTHQNKKQITKSSCQTSNPGGVTAESNVPNLLLGSLRIAGPESILLNRMGN